MPAQVHADVRAVVGAVGGVGASTLAALLARQLAPSGERVALVDLDHGAGGIEVLLGIEEAPGVRWSDLLGVRGTVAVEDLAGLLPRWQGVEVLSADRSGRAPHAEAVGAVWDALVRGCDAVVVDLPRHSLGPPDGGTTSATVEHLLAERAEVLLVTGQDVLGVAGALAVRPALDEVPARLVLRRRTRARVAPVEAAELLDLSLLALLPTDRRLPQGVDRGFGPVASRWSRLGRAVARAAEGGGPRRARRRHG